MSSKWGVLKHRFFLLIPTFLLALRGTSALVVTPAPSVKGWWDSPTLVPICATAAIVPRPPAVGSSALGAVSARTRQGTVPALRLLESKAVRQSWGKLRSCCHIPSITPRGPCVRVAFSGEACWTLRCTLGRRSSISELNTAPTSHTPAENIDVNPSVLFKHRDRPAHLTDSSAPCAHHPLDTAEDRLCTSPRPGKHFGAKVG